MGAGDGGVECFQENPGRASKRANVEASRPHQALAGIGTTSVTSHWSELSLPLNVHVGIRAIGPSVLIICHSPSSMLSASSK